MESREEFLASLCEIERWLQDNRIEAGRWLPRLLALSGPDLSRELARHPELQPGISRLLLEVADDTVGRNPARAHELTTAVIDSVGSDLSLPRHEQAPDLRARAWTAHAGALRGLGRRLEALAAIAEAAAASGTLFAAAWNLALVQVEEARILHDMGESTEALFLIRRSAEMILLHSDVKRYVRVRMYEVLILWEVGERVAAAEVWRTMAREAAQRGDAVFMALLESATAVFQLRHGGAEAAARLFEIAHDAFDHAGLTREAVRARWGVAEAAVARRRFHDAISEYYKVQALALADGNLREAALASVEIVELLRITGRNGEVPRLAHSQISVFADAGQENAVKSWLLLRDFAMLGQLTPERVDVLRCFFRNFVLQPNVRLE
jgi:tetratricopeptide (TPR) repeat protein